MLFNGNKLTIGWLEGLAKQHFRNTGIFSYSIENIEVYMVMKQSRVNPDKPMYLAYTFYIDDKKVSKKTMKEFLA